MGNTNRNINDITKDWGFFGKLLSKPVYSLLLLYYELDDSSTSLTNKMVIIAIFAYFVSPVDLIPDIFPVLGISDDLTVLAMASGFARAHQTPQVTKRAQRKLAEIFEK